MKRPRLPPHADDAARTLAVLAIVAREVRRGARARVQPPRMSLAAMLASLGIVGARGSVPPYPELRLRFDGLDADTMASLHEIRAREYRHGAAPHAASAPASIGLPGAGAEPNPDFYPDFSFPVKQGRNSAIGRRTECAAICEVSLDFFDRNVQRLMDDYEFPRPLPRDGQRKWQLASVTAWAATPQASIVLAHARRAHAKAEARA